MGSGYPAVWGKSRWAMRFATIQDQLFDVVLLHDVHLHWPELDVDLDLDRIEHPEK
ncbi:MAG: hypothetical protein M1608_12870 [Candidatus Omnitrophica bacterium]|nr:hypothetical protein [Candidatus Omnitrophota bacterium]